MQELKPIKEGKVREIYDNGDSLIMVATDRISCFDVILNNGEKAALTTDDSVKQDGAKFQRLYACLEAGDYFKLIVGENNTLIDIKEYWVGDTADVTSVLYNSMITLDGTQYFVTSDTVFIPVSGEADSIADIQRGQEVTFVVADDDSHELLMIGY